MRRHRRISPAFYVRQPDTGFQPSVAKYGGENGVANEIIVRDILWNTIEISITLEDIIEISPLKDQRGEDVDPG